MIKVGITGGIGSGKSTVCALLAESGVPVYNSDCLARKLVNGSEKIKREIVGLLGGAAYRGEVLDSEYVAGKVFSDRILLVSLNAIIHPAVADDFERWALAFTDRPYIVLESAILFESGFDRLVDRIVAVYAPEEVRLERVTARTANHSGGGVSREEIRRRMAAQLSDTERETRANYTLDNGGGLRELAVRVGELDKLLKQ